MAKLKYVRIVKHPLYKGYTGKIIVSSADTYTVIIDETKQQVKIDRKFVEPVSGIKQPSKSLQKSSTVKYIGASGSGKGLSVSKSKSAFKTASKSASKTASKTRSKILSGSNYFELLEQNLVKNSDSNSVFKEFSQTVTSVFSLDEIGINVDEITNVLDKIIDKNTSLQVNLDVKLFVLAYIFILLNQRNKQIPQRPIYKEYITPNDDPSYLLNASIKLRILPSNFDKNIFDNYVATILSHFETSIIPNTYRIGVLESLRRKRFNSIEKQVKAQKSNPIISKMRFFQKSSKDIKKEEISKRNLIIDQYINAISNGSLVTPVSLDRDTVINYLNDLRKVKVIMTPGRQKRSDVYQGNRYEYLSPSIQNPKTPEDKFLFDITNRIKIEERNVNVLVDVENPVKLKAKEQVFNFVMNRINTGQYDRNTTNLLIKFIENPESTNFTQEERNILKEYKLYYNKLKTIYISVIPGINRQGMTLQKTNFKNYLKDKTKFLQNEIVRLDSLKEKFPEYEFVLANLIQKINEIYDYTPTKIQELRAETELLDNKDKIFNKAVSVLYNRLMMIVNKSKGDYNVVKMYE